MRDKWYGDNRDLVKWGVLLELSDRFHCKQILQVLYYQPEMIKVGEKNIHLRREVIEHFRRDVNSIVGLPCSATIKLLRDEFGDREAYLQSINAAIGALDESPSVVFLDPDTGLEPESGNYNSTHVRSVEVQEIWKSLRPGDVLVFYQHQDNRSGREWIERKRIQFESALGIMDPLAQRVELAYGQGIARDVAFYFAKKLTVFEADSALQSPHEPQRRQTPRRSPPIASRRFGLAR
jgi:hypothetical protein